MRKITEERFCEVCGVSSKFKKLVLINFLEKYYVKNIGNNLEDLGNLKTLIQEVYLMIMKLA